MRDIADNCLILRGITHPFASSLQKAVEEFSPEPNGTLVKNAATGKWNETHCISCSDVTRIRACRLVIAGI